MHPYFTRMAGLQRSEAVLLTRASPGVDSSLWG